MWLIVGLGNPGRRYQATRHNLGFRLIDRLARAEGLKLQRDLDQAEVGRGAMASQAVILAKPQTYMNLSGSSVARLAKRFRLDVDDIVTAHDDLDLPLGRIKVTAGGGHGGHKGVRSIIEHLGDNGFYRIKMGIGRPEGHQEKDGVEDYVLQPFHADEVPIVEEVIGRAAEAVRAILTEGLAAAQTRFNRNSGSPNGDP